MTLQTDLMISARCLNDKILINIFKIHVNAFIPTATMITLIRFSIFFPFYNFNRMHFVIGKHIDCFVFISIIEQMFINKYVYLCTLLEFDCIETNDFVCIFIAFACSTQMFPLHIDC